MRQQGFTIIELIIVVSIIGILAVALALQFTGWRDTYLVESQIKTMYTDLMSARTYAMQQNVSYFMRLNTATPNAYNTYTDTNGNDALDIGTDTSVTMLSRQTLRHKLQWDIGGNPADIKLDRRGLVEPTTNPLADINIWVLDDSGNPYNTGDVDYDCLFLSGTRITVGKYDGSKVPVCQSK